MYVPLFVCLHFYYGILCRSRSRRFIVSKKYQKYNNTHARVYHSICVSYHAYVRRLDSDGVFFIKDMVVALILIPLASFPEESLLLLHT